MEYKPRKNQFVDSLSGLSINPLAVSGIKNTKNIDTAKNIPVNFSQNLCFWSLRVRAKIVKGTKMKNHRSG